MEETAGYIHERLRIAGATNPNIFSEEAIETIHRFARGIPRVTNLLCEHALINSFVEQQKPVRKESVEEAAREFQLDPFEAASPVGSFTPNSEAAPLVKSLLQNLANLVERMGQQEPSLESNRERKT
jgi:hypothetical protein